MGSMTKNELVIYLAKEQKDWFEKELPKEDKEGFALYEECLDRYKEAFTVLEATLTELYKVHKAVQ